MTKYKERSQKVTKRPGSQKVSKKDSKRSKKEPQTGGIWSIILEKHIDIFNFLAIPFFIPFYMFYHPLFADFWAGPRLENVAPGMLLAYFSLSEKSPFSHRFWEAKVGPGP